MTAYVNLKFGKRKSFSALVIENEIFFPSIEHGWVAQSLEHRSSIREVPGSNLCAAQLWGERFWRSAKDSVRSMQHPAPVDSAKWTGNRDWGLNE